MYTHHTQYPHKPHSIGCALVFHSMLWFVILPEPQKARTVQRNWWASDKPKSPTEFVVFVQTSNGWLYPVSILYLWIIECLHLSYYNAEADNVQNRKHTSPRSYFLWKYFLFISILLTLMHTSIFLNPEANLTWFFIFIFDKNLGFWPNRCRLDTAGKRKVHRSSGVVLRAFRQNIDWNYFWWSGRCFGSDCLLRLSLMSLWP